jgi:hypothetical protein
MTFRKNISPQFSGSGFATSFHAGSFFVPEGEAGMFLRKSGSISTDYTTLYPRRQNSSVRDVTLRLFFEEQYFPLVSNYLSYYFSPVFGLFLEKLYEDKKIS